MNTEFIVGALVAAIYVLVEALKAIGFQKRREKSGEFHPFCPIKSDVMKELCKWSRDDHQWIMDLRDKTRDLAHFQKESHQHMEKLSVSLHNLGERLVVNVRTIESLANDIQDLSEKIHNHCVVDPNGNGKNK
jgi:hypothetical protein